MKIKNIEIYNELNAKIGEKNIIVYGTGAIYRELKPLFLLLNKRVKFFIETIPKKEEFEGTKIYSKDDVVNYGLIEKKDIVVICTSYWKDLLLEDDFPLGNNINIYNPLLNYEWQLLKEYLSINTLEKSFHSFLTKNEKVFLSVNKKNEKILIMVQEHSGYSAPYHSILLGIVLTAKNYDVHFLFNDLSVYGDLDRGVGFVEYQNKKILDVLDNVKKYYGIQYSIVSQQENKQLSSIEESKIDKFISLAYLWFTKQYITKRDTVYFSLKKQMKDTSQKIKSFLENMQFDKVYVYTGVHFEWNILRILVEEMGLEYFSSEYILKGYSFTKNSPVVYQRENIKSKNSISALGLIKEKLNVKIPNIEVNPSENGVLIPLNIFWDSAAFTDNDLFLTFEEWLVETIRFILDNCKSKIYIRQHPHEKAFTSGNDLKKHLINVFGHDNRFVFIDKDSNISTYELLNKVKLVLPNTTTFGLEAVMLGRNVIVKNDVYYCNEPGVVKARSKEHYFNSIRYYLENEISIEEEAKQNAKMLLGIQKFGYTDTTFGHKHSDVEALLNMDLNEILDLSSVKLAIDVIEKDKSIIENNINSFLNFNI